MLIHAHLELRDNRAVPRLAPAFRRLEAQLFEAMDLRLGELRKGELAERRAAPEGERLLEGRERSLLVVFSRLASTTGE